MHNLNIVETLIQTVNQIIYQLLIRRKNYQLIMFLRQTQEIYITLNQLSQDTFF